MTRRAIYARISLFPALPSAHSFLFPSPSGPANFARFPAKCHPHDRGLARQNYTSVDGRIPGRRDACTDCVELAAPSSESRERRRDARRDGTRSTRMAQARRTIRRRFSSFSLIRLALSLYPFPFSPLPLSLSRSLSLSLSRLFLSLFLSRPIVRTVGYNIQFIMYL